MSPTIKVESVGFNFGLPPVIPIKTKELGPGDFHFGPSPSIPNKMKETESCGFQFGLVMDNPDYTSTGFQFGLALSIQVNSYPAIDVDLRQYYCRVQ